ncbi:MAG: bifunctional DNA-formamidopyrimidine glycosylase/DNA-(apurinic or apyrimidinic site) lyase [Deltaproteobacteria bacterium]|nr:bifunctional DNA-formamidopyrimidine glycosylase/DNA-(apurinic or apyrimidinic site) lyase [Deltaproteobacteria bacterium]
MPELPEVESLRQILERSLAGRTFRHATVKEARLRLSVTAELSSAIAGRTIERISRRAKYLLIEVAGGQVMLVHLGMSGSLTHRGHSFDPGPFDPRHDHIEFALDDGSMLVYNDPRRFGLIKIVARADLNNIAELKYLGPEPLGREFSAAYLWQATRGRTVAIKNLLMDQRIVAGVGNIYASEILFRAGVRPTRRGGKVTRAEAGRIVTTTQEVLREAISSRGTTFRSYRDSRGQPGRFARLLRVYDREGKPCLKCNTPIRAITLGQRSSFYCPKCQR